MSLPCHFKRLALPLACALSLGACGKTADSSSSVVKIGYAAPLTGPQSHYGEEYKHGVELAIEDENASHPVIGGKAVTFQLVAEDDQADPKTATQVAQKLVDDKVAGVIGHFNSGCTIPASKIYHDAGIPEISMSSSPQYTAQGFDTAFRSMTADDQQGGVMGQYLVTRLHAKRIAVIDDRTAYGQGLADEVAKAVVAAGGSIVKREFTNDKATDFAAILTSIKSIHPDAIYFGGIDAQSSTVARQMKELGIKAMLVSGDMSMTPNFLKLAGAAAEGTIVSLAGLPLDKMPKGADYAARYKARFHAEVETYSPYGYDATRAMIAAMKAADSTAPASYLPKLAAIDYPGITSAHWAYDAHGNLKQGSIVVYKAVAGKWNVLDTVGGK
ncbi:branched-chain amino acid ABC transporter substrate-binding protein [Paludibacterium yongneupense]|uniref:branched-chain amino acid ABC transporter substrate-binding protein n=1 Tax=Paludibacterium yongneupense TaxID=400061 RepID=UPI0003FAD42B|nr:branched-chain amino acid ABC transporter substrate-binding protein [Paludibacterium yongneupense]